MTITADSILTDFRDDIAAYDESRPRSQQVSIGASQLYGCTAENIFRLRGEEGERRLSWQAIVGTAIHDYADTARTAVRPGVITEQRFTFREVTATVDYLDPTQALLVDFKSKDDADVIESLDGAKPEWVAQVMLGAAAAREAGYKVDYVAILVLPRDGDLDGARVFGPWEFDEQAAIDAAKWAADVEALAADPDVDPRDHRGKPFFFCKEYCPFVSVCRNTEEEPELAAELAEPAQRYREAQDEKDAAEERMKALRPVLFGYSGKAGAVSVTTSKGSTKDVEVEDIEAMRELAKFVTGEIPTTTIERTTSPKLIVRWAKK